MMMATPKKQKQQCNRFSADSSDTPQKIEQPRPDREALASGMAIRRDLHKIKKKASLTNKDKKMKRRSSSLEVPFSVEGSDGASPKSEVERELPEG